ncbi:HAD-IIB family hydrolase [Pseudomonas sp. TH31]|uniref:HAD-IIB family hydrolase n=1 Tax=Pseudomonas sp. TH31 TaxID=2796396 RepID=UPI0019120BD4|nr:HAD-IIB family hydrolase [Pseudomonas sp. TH31]MBK5413285.1 HAD-IIB family hydrolase [Pseudomonas sp. TH31]
MRPLTDHAPDTFASIRFVLTDMDETLTHRGRLAAATYEALERLQASGIKVIPVTAAPSGWCDQMARMWPVDGVIGENGGLFFRRGTDSHKLVRDYWHDGDQATLAHQKRKQLIEFVLDRLPWARLAEDQDFRQTSVAFELPGEDAHRQALGDALSAAGAEHTFNNLWALGWFGAYDKLTMARRVLHRIYGLGTEQMLDKVFYSGDSLNDGPMFNFFRHTLGVSTIQECLHQLPKAPAWISTGPGGAGFVEAAEAILACQR